MQDQWQIDAKSIRVEVIYALPHRAWRVLIELPDGATVADALVHAEVKRGIPPDSIHPDRLAIFSRPARLTTRLRDGDRVELLRPLLCDPKEARRQRARTGLKR